MRKINLTLPEFAFLDDEVCDLNELQGRNVILHVRTASVIEFLPSECVGGLTARYIKAFSYTNFANITESYVAVAHYICADDKFDDDELATEILDKSIEFFKRYMAWEDDNIIHDEIIKDISRKN